MDHDEQCFKNQALRDLGVGGSLASCTCGLDDLLRVARAAKEYRHSTTNWLMDDGDQGDLVRADGEHLDEALKALPEGLDLIADRVAKAGIDAIKDVEHLDKGG